MLDGKKLHNWASKETDNCEETKYFVADVWDSWTAMMLLSWAIILISFLVLGMVPGFKKLSQLSIHFLGREY